MNVIELSWIRCLVHSYCEYSFLSNTVTTELPSLYNCDFCLACYRRKTFKACVTEESVKNETVYLETFIHYFCTVYMLSLLHIIFYTHIDHLCLLSI